jgi:hypothetical protein
MDEIRQVTGARIDIPNARDAKDPSARVEIQIKGAKAQVAQAKKMIEEKRDVFDQTVTKTLEVDKKHHRALIGAGGWSFALPYMDIKLTFQVLHFAILSSRPADLTIDVNLPEQFNFPRLKLMAMLSRLKARQMSSIRSSLG